METQASSRPDEDTRKPVPENPGPLFKRLYLGDKRSLKSIIREYDISQRKLQDYLRAEDVTFRPPGRPATGLRAGLKPATPRMIERYHSMSLNKAAKQSVMPPLVMLRRLLLADVPLRPEDLARVDECLSHKRETLPPDPSDLLKRIYVEERRSMAWITEHYDIHYARVQRILRKLNIKIRPEG